MNYGNQIFPILVYKPKRKKTGRPTMDDRKAMNAIFYIAHSTSWMSVESPTTKS